jgi:hypothetical protein
MILKIILKITLMQYLMQNQGIHGIQVVDCSSVKEYAQTEDRNCSWKKEM